MNLRLALQISVVYGRSGREFWSRSCSSHSDYGTGVYSCSAAPRIAGKFVINWTRRVKHGTLVEIIHLLLTVDYGPWSKQTGWGESRMETSQR